MKLADPVPVEIHLAGHVDRVQDHGHGFVGKADHQKHAGMNLRIVAQHLGGGQESFHRARLTHGLEDIFVAGFHADVQRDTAALGGGGDHLVRAGTGDDAVGGVPGEIQVALHHAVEQVDGAGMVFQQIIVQPHDMADAMIVGEQFKLVQDGLDLALAHTHAVEIAHTAEGALGAAAPVGENRGKPGVFRFEAIEGADGAGGGIAADIDQVVGRGHVDLGLHRRVTGIGGQKLLTAAQAEKRQVIGFGLAVDRLDKRGESLFRFPQKGHVGGLDVFQDPLDVIADMDAADRYRNVVALDPVADGPHGAMGHGEHAGHTDQVGFELAQVIVELSLPNRVKIELVGGRELPASLENFVVEIADADLNPDFPQPSCNHQQPVRRIVGVAASLGRIKTEEFRVGIRRRHQKDAFNPSLGKMSVNFRSDFLRLGCGGGHAHGHLRFWANSTLETGGFAAAW